MNMLQNDFSLAYVNVCGIAPSQISETFSPDVECLQKFFD
jgi:hypothetical protein